MSEFHFVCGPKLTEKQAPQSAQGDGRNLQHPPAEPQLKCHCPTCGVSNSMQVTFFSLGAQTCSKGGLHVGTQWYPWSRLVKSDKSIQADPVMTASVTQLVNIAQHERVSRTH